MLDNRTSFEMKYHFQNLYNVLVDAQLVKHSCLSTGVSSAKLNYLWIDRHFFIYQLLRLFRNSQKFVHECNIIILFILESKHMRWNIFDKFLEIVIWIVFIALSLIYDRVKSADHKSNCLFQVGIQVYEHLITLYRF